MSEQIAKKNKGGRPRKNPEEMTPEQVRQKANQRRRERKAEMKKMGALPGQNLVARQIKGHVSRWVTDEENNIDAKLNSGYTFVKSSDQSEYASTNDLGSAISKVTGVREGGQPQRSYLMMIPEQFYQEDQQEKEAAIRRKEAGIHRGNPNNDAALEGHTYNPRPGANHLMD